MATQNTKTKTTLADKDKKVLMILGALVILALAWFLGYQKFNEQRETVISWRWKCHSFVQKYPRKHR